MRRANNGFLSRGKRHMLIADVIIKADIYIAATVSEGNVNINLLISSPDRQLLCWCCQGHWLGDDHRHRWMGSVSRIQGKITTPSQPINALIS